MFDKEDIQQVLTNAGLQSLGFENPSISVHWTNNSVNTPTEGGAGTLSLSSSDNWLAPLGGILFKSAEGMRIYQPSGEQVAAASLVFRIHPMIYLRLKRFYATILEGKSADTDQPERPVPYYFVYSSGASAEGGCYSAGDDLKVTGQMTIHDECGMPVDPMAVACALDQIVEKHRILEPKDLLSTTRTSQADRQIYKIGQSGSNTTTIYLTSLFGKPKDGSDLENVTLISNGVFTLTDPAKEVKFSGTGKENWRIGPATTGTLGTGYTRKAPASGITLKHDFFRGFVVDIQEHLLGVADTSDVAYALEERPSVRHKETLGFFTNGNAAMGGANAVLSGSPDDAFVVSPVIEGDFTLPVDGTDAQSAWPSFPAGTPSTPGKIPVSLRDGFNPSAHFILGSDENTGVAVTLSGLTAGHAVRVYHRVFLPDAREGRGGGAGSVAMSPSGNPSNAQVTLILRDPLALKRWGGVVTLPVDPTLHLDVVVINSEGNARVFGNVTATIGAPAALSPEELALTPAETNPFTSAGYQAISSAGIMGIKPPKETLTSGDALNTILQLTGESNPRETPRLPAMARRDTIIASRKGNAFKGQLSGMHLVKDARNALYRKGSPGSKGGREFHNVAVQTDGGLLAYDMTRAAFRRAKNLIERLVELKSDNWNEPSAATSGSISGTLLQTIASGVETPEFGLFTSSINNFFTDHPDWSSVVDWIQNNLGGGSSFMAGIIGNKINDLRTNSNANRLYNEFKREFCACTHGRRDASRALKNAFENAREFIYIEGPAFMPTGYGSDPVNLFNVLKDRMTARSGLRLILALSKELDYGTGYETFAAREYKKRQECITQLQALTPAGGRAVVFHPVGFPGRPLELMTNIVIVDDVFALVGTSAIRRRGMTFDGGQDLVFTDCSLKSGKPAFIREIRRKMMAAHLGIRPPEANAMPDPQWIRLADGNQAFEVFRELLDSGGAGMIEKLWDGKVPGKPDIPESAFPNENVADPDGRNYNTLAGLLYSALAAAATPPAWP